MSVIDNGVYPKVLVPELDRESVRTIRYDKLGIHGMYEATLTGLDALFDVEGKKILGYGMLNHSTRQISSSPSEILSQMPVLLVQAEESDLTSEFLRNYFSLFDVKDSKITPLVAYPLVGGTIPRSYVMLNTYDFKDTVNEEKVGICRATQNVLIQESDPNGEGFGQEIMLYRTPHRINSVNDVFQAGGRHWRAILAHNDNAFRSYEGNIPQNQIALHYDIDQVGLADFNIPLVYFRRNLIRLLNFSKETWAIAKALKSFE